MSLNEHSSIDGLEDGETGIIVPFSLGLAIFLLVEQQSLTEKFYYIKKEETRTDWPWWEQNYRARRRLS